MPFEDALRQISARKIASATVGSLFEPHTAIIRKGQPGHPTAFGRALWLDEVEGGLSSRYAVLEGHPAEKAPWPPSLDHPLPVCKHPPRLLAGDRGVYTAAHERYATLYWTSSHHRDGVPSSRSHA
jgi:transposase, IS5 family